MGQALTHDLEALRSAAAGLRQLAAEGRYLGDQLVYLIAAKTMEWRAERLAGRSFPPDRAMAGPGGRRPVDLIV